MSKGQRVKVNHVHCVKTELHSMWAGILAGLVRATNVSTGHVNNKQSLHPHCTVLRLFQ